MDWVPIVLVIFLAIVIFVLAILVSYYSTACTETPIAQGTYGVWPGLSGTTLSVCSLDGSVGNQRCQFAVQSLEEAATLCNQNYQICKAFYYDSSGLMEYQDPNSDLTSAFNGGLYIRQAPVTVVG